MEKHIFTNGKTLLKFLSDKDTTWPELFSFLKKNKDKPLSIMDIAQASFEDKSSFEAALYCCQFLPAIIPEMRNLAFSFAIGNQKSVRQHKDLHKGYDDLLMATYMKKDPSVIHTMRSTYYQEKDQKPKVKALLDIGMAVSLYNPIGAALSTRNKVLEFISLISPKNEKETNLNNEMSYQMKCLDTIYHKISAL